MKNETFQRIALTHFGIYDDPLSHINLLEHELNNVDAWISKVMPTNPSLEELEQQLMGWTYQKSLAQGVVEKTIDTISNLLLNSPTAS